MNFARTRAICSLAPWALLSAIAAAIPGCSDSTTTGGSGDAPIPAKYQAFAAAFDQERQQLGVPGASVALIEHNQVTFAHGFGTNRVSNALPNDVAPPPRGKSLAPSPERFSRLPLP
jgi:CubicO group peptidase (beta-lactamase class C family)